MAGFVLLTGIILGSLATVCGMILVPGTYTFEVKEPWQALGFSVRNNKAKEELALGDGRAFKEVRRGRREVRERLVRKEYFETDESELMATWMSFPGSPNTQRNYNVDTVNIVDTTAYTTRNESDYKKERTVNGENQECESLESGYAPRYLVKEVDQEQAVLREFFRKVESLFHDVVHGLVLELVKLIGCTGTPLGLVTWIVLLRFSHLFFVTVQKFAEEESDRHEQGQEQKSESRYKKELHSAIAHSAHLQQLTSSARNGGSTEAASRSQSANIARHTDTSRGDQEHSSVRKSKRSRISASIPADSSNSAGTKLSSATGTYGSPAVSSDNDGGNRSEHRKGRKGTKAW